MTGDEYRFKRWVKIAHDKVIPWLKKISHGFAGDNDVLTSKDVLFIGNCPYKRGWLLLHTDVLLGELDAVLE